MIIQDLTLCFTLPPLSVQLTIASEIEAEENTIKANLELIKLFDKKIESTIARVWG